MPEHSSHFYCADPPPLSEGGFGGADRLVRKLVSGVVCALLTSVIVLAQDPKPAPPPLKEAVKKQVDVQVVRERQVEERAEVAKIQAVRKARLIVGRDRMIQRLTLQGRPIVRGELLFVRNVCQLKIEQLRAISRDTEQTLAEFILDMVDRNLAGVHPQIRSLSPDPTQRLQERLAVAIKNHLTPEQYALYKSEIDKRAASRKQAALTYLLDTLDRALLLSSNQKERLRESLSAHWDEGWYLFLEYVLNGNEFFEVTLEPYVVAVLTADQRKIWQDLQKVQGLGGFGNIPLGANGENDAVFEKLGLVEKIEPKPAAPVIKGR